MADTARYRMPLLDAAQAQKHVTLNEALARVDALAAGRAETIGRTMPPASPADGEVHVVGAGASGDWAGQDDALAIWSNGGWAFVPPWGGARFWNAASSTEAVYTGTAWVGSGQPAAPSGAATLGEVVEIDHVISAGATSTVPDAIPDKAILLGVTGRVVETIGGASAWSLGTASGPNRYGSGIGTTVNAFAHGVSGSPLAYYGGTDLVLTSEGGDFTAGRVLLALHMFRLLPPAAV